MWFGSLESEEIIKGNIYEIQSEILRIPTGYLIFSFKKSLHLTDFTKTL